MRWLKRERGKASSALAGMLLLLVLMVWVPVSVAGVSEGSSGLATPTTGTVQATPTMQATPTTDPAVVAATAKEQLRKLERDNDRSLNAWFWNVSATLGPIAAALFAVFGVLWTAKVAQNKNLADNQAERTRRDDEQQRWLKNQATEREKQAEERFQKVVEGLGSERTEAKVGAVITLRTFLQPGYERFYRQAFDLAVAHLRLRKAEASVPELSSTPAPIPIIPEGDLRQEQQPPPTASIPLDSLSQALITVFRESFPLVREELKKTKAQFEPQQLDARGVRLDNAYLAGADLAKAWLVQASLREAVLLAAHLEGANLLQAHLEGADLTRAHLEGAYLFGAHLEEAYLFGAHLKGAYLSGAEFEGANLSEAHLEGAILGWAQRDGVYLTQAHLEGADLTRAHFEGAYLSAAQREMCIKKGAIFDDGLSVYF